MTFDSPAKYSVYLAGPMTNIPAFNFPQFFDATAWLRSLMGWDVKSPAEKDLEKIPWEEMQKIPGFDTGDLTAYVANSTFTMSNAMEWDLPAILNSDGIVLLDGWEKSTGARWERTVAEALGRDIWLLGQEPSTGGLGTTWSLRKDEAKDRLTQWLREFPNADFLLYKAEIAAETDEPDTHRTPTEADRLLAGTLSTIWPMCHRHPSDALHLAIFINDQRASSTIGLVSYDPVPVGAADVSLGDLATELKSRLKHVPGFIEGFDKLTALVVFDG